MIAIIPLTSDPNQRFEFTTQIDGANIKLRANLRYNRYAKYWVMTVSRAADDICMLDGVPLLPGQYPAADLLKQFEYLGLGSCAVVPTVRVPSALMPDDTNLGTEYVLAWGDRIAL